MVEVLKAHLSLSIFGSLFCLMFVYAIKRDLRYAVRVEGITEKLNLLIPTVFEKTIDIQFGSTSKESMGTPGVLTILAKEFKKGYDLVQVTQSEPGSQVPVHKHFRTNELFYVTEGKIQIFICDPNKEHKECEDSCDHLHTMSAGDWCFVKKRQKHCVTVLEPAKYLIIAKPPLFSRIGKIYESFCKK